MMLFQVVCYVGGINVRTEICVNILEADEVASEMTACERYERIEIEELTEANQQNER